MVIKNKYINWIGIGIGQTNVAHDLKCLRRHLVRVRRQPMRNLQPILISLMLKVPQGVLRALAGVYPNAAFKLLMTIAKVLVSRMRKGNARYIDSLLAAHTAK